MKMYCAAPSNFFYKIFTIFMVVCMVSIVFWTVYFFMIQSQYLLIIEYKYCCIQQIKWPQVKNIFGTIIIISTDMIHFFISNRPRAKLQSN